MIDDSFDAIAIARIQSHAGPSRVGWVHRKCIPFAILVRPTIGSYRVTGAEREIRVASGELALVAADTPVAFAHHGDRQGRMHVQYLHVQATLHGALDPCALCRTPHRIHGVLAERLGAGLAQLLTLRGDGLAVRMQRLGMAYQLLAEAMADAAAHPRAEALRAGAIRFGRLLAWMREYMHRPLGVDEIAAAAGLSRSRLHALFRQQFGCAPMALLKQLRLAGAARLLLTGDDSLAAVAEAVGFANPFHLSREFAQHYGMPPSRYRSEQRLWEAMRPGEGAPG